jgi:hypothetical protein
VGGSGLLANKYNNSLFLLLSTIFPDFEWIPWKFIQCPRNFWDKEENQKKFIDWAGKQLKIKEMSDWYNVTQKVCCWNSQGDR